MGRVYVNMILIELNFCTSTEGSASQSLTDCKVAPLGYLYSALDLQALNIGGINADFDIYKVLNFFKYKAANSEQLYSLLFLDWNRLR